MEIKQENNSRNGYFEALEDQNVAGKMTYVWAGSNKLIIDHTEVNPAFNGKGVGKLLVLEAVKYARQNQIKILPLCPFAKSVFDRNPDLHDVLF